jgi:hypothetical protein
MGWSGPTQKSVVGLTNHGVKSEHRDGTAEPVISDAMLPSTSPPPKRHRIAPPANDFAAR